MSNIEEKLANLPPELLPYKDNILATVKPVIEITLSPADDLPLWASKVGGKPYLPLDVEYPHNEKGEPLGFLAQFNLEELPKTDELPDKGILAFFIAQDTLYGLDFDNQLKQDGFRVLYFDEVLMDESLLWKSFPRTRNNNNENEWYSPIEENTCYSTSFELLESEISFEDFNFQQDFFDNNDFRQCFMKCKNRELIFDRGIFYSATHHLLGYPYFTQQDPRDDRNYTNYVLLFQLVSQYDNEIKIYFGDSGVMNFFIDPKDLANKDFSKVLYNWDC